MSEAHTARLAAMQSARQAAHHIKEGNFDAARELLTDSTAQDDRYAAGFQVFGDLCVHEDDTVQAMERYNRALELDPQNPRLLLSLGKLYLAEHPERAQDLFWRALRYEPGVPELEAALRDAIGQMEPPEEDSVPDDEPVLADEDALAALTEQPGEMDTEPESFEITDDESTAELETIAMPTEDTEPPASLADTIVNEAPDTDDAVSRTDDDLDLSDMTRAALADLDLPEGTGEIPIETSTFTDIGIVEGEQAAFDDEDAEEAPPAFDLDELIESESEEPPESNTGDQSDLSMLAADVDMNESPAEAPVFDIDELPDEDLTLTEPDISPEQPAAEQESALTGSSTEDTFGDTAVEELVAGFEDDDSDLAFLVGGDQQTMTTVETPEEDTEPVETPAEQMETVTIAEEPDEKAEPEPPVVAAGEDVPEPVTDVDTDTDIEPPTSAPDDIANLKPTDSIEIGPDALDGGTIDIGPEELPTGFFDTELDTASEPPPETEPEPTGEVSAAVEPEPLAEEPDSFELDIAPEPPIDLEPALSAEPLTLEEAPVEEPIAVEPELEPTGEVSAVVEPEPPAEEPDSIEPDIAPEPPIDLEPALSAEPVTLEEAPAEEPVEIEPEPEPELPASEPVDSMGPETAGSQDITEHEHPAQTADYSTLLAGMDLSDIEEEQSGMTGGILELGEEELTGLSFDESTPESIEEPVLSDDERAELSELEKMLNEDTEASEKTEAEFSFEATTADETDETGTVQEPDTGIDYSDILAGTVPTDVQPEIPVSPESSIPEDNSGYEQMLAEMSGMGTEPLPADTGMTVEEPPTEPAQADQPVVDTVDEQEHITPEPEFSAPDLEALSDEDDTTDEQSESVEDLMKGTMSLRLDLAGDDTAGVDDSSLDSLITDYMSALQTFSGEEHPAAPPQDAVEAESVEPVSPELPDEPPAAPDEPITMPEPELGLSDIPAGEFGADATEPLEPDEATATMAEIFARQGLISRAVDIYSRIVERAPDDMKARTRLEELTRLLDESSDSQ